MSKELVPQEARFAAKRGFVRTASQSLATSLILPAGITFAFTQDALTAAGTGVASMVVSAVVNGLQSYFDILHRGIPEDYRAGAPSEE